jgi:signal peptide peptidase SppA
VKVSMDEIHMPDPEAVREPVVLAFEHEGAFVRISGPPASGEATRTPRSPFVLLEEARMSTAPVGSRILSFIDAGFWAMHPAHFVSMREIVGSWASAPGFPPALSRADKDAAIAAAQAGRPTQAYQAPQTIAVLSIFGVISPRGGMMDDMSQQGCSMESFGAKYRSVMTDSNVAGVLVEVDSPGGNVFQVPETADLIYSLRDQKPNVAVVTGMCASAAFWLGSQFGELVACPSSEVGSIGVLMRHDDLSKAAEAAGVTVDFITSPRDGNKAEGNPFTPLGDDTREYYNSRTDEYYDMFLSALARGRDVSSQGNTSAASLIDQTWGRGRMVGAAKALDLGMVDRIGTMQSEIDRMAGKLAKKAGGGARADADEQGRARALARLRSA